MNPKFIDSFGIAQT